jgi:hypothetical protein
MKAAGTFMLLHIQEVVTASAAEDYVGRATGLPAGVSVIPSGGSSTPRVK